jgi:hypothetical protein
MAQACPDLDIFPVQGEFKAAYSQDGHNRKEAKKMRAERIDLGSHEEAYYKRINADVDTTFWGYIIRGHGLADRVTVISQYAAAIVGILLVIGAIVFWLVPVTNMAVDFGGLQYGMSIALFLFGLVLVWFASHGTEFEYHIDLEKREVREVLRNGKGVARPTRKLDFADVGSVFIDRSGSGATPASLTLRYKRTSQVFVVARDVESNLRPLMERLGRDILPGSLEPVRTVPVRAKRGFLIGKAKGVVERNIAPRRVSLAA